LNVKTNETSQNRILPFNGSIMIRNYDLTKPYGQNNYKTAYFNYNSVSGSDALNIMANIVRLLTGH
jgi:hypothetical protein